MSPRIDHFKFIDSTWVIIAPFFWRKRSLISICVSEYNDYLWRSSLDVLFMNHLTYKKKVAFIKSAWMVELSYISVYVYGGQHCIQVYAEKKKLSDRRPFTRSKWP